MLGERKLLIVKMLLAIAWPLLGIARRVFFILSVDLFRKSPQRTIVRYCWRKTKSLISQKIVLGSRFSVLRKCKCCLRNNRIDLLYPFTHRADLYLPTKNRRAL